MSEEFSEEQERLEADFHEIADCASVIITLCNEAMCNDSGSANTVSNLVEAARNTAQRIGWIADKHQDVKSRGDAEDWMLDRK